MQYISKGGKSYLVFNRVSYGAADTPPDKKEYRFAPSGAVGTRHEIDNWMKDKNIRFEFGVDGYVLIDKDGSREFILVRESKDPLKFLLHVNEGKSEELRQQLFALGLEAEGKSVDEMEDMLAVALWAKEHPNEPFPEQFAPMLAHDSSKQSKEWLSANIKDSDWWIQCLLYSCPVYTPNGKVQIGKLKVGDEVLSYGKGVEVSEVREVIKNAPTEKFVKVSLVGRNEDITCTPNHPLYLRDGKKPAGEVVAGDEVAVLEIVPSVFQKEVLLGTLLGDGSIVNRDFKSRKCSIKFGHCIEQQEYLREKIEILDMEGDKGGFKVRNTNQGTLSINWCSVASRYLWEVYEDVYVGGKKTVEKIIDRLTLVSLAYWFMDDGSYIRANTIHPNLLLCMSGFSSSDRKLVSDKLLEWGFKNNVSSSGSLIMDWKSSEEFSKQIARYVPPSMRYKLCDGEYEYQPIKEVGKREVRYVPVDKVVVYEVKKPQTTYDITVEPNNNFFASTGFLVHNTKYNGMRSLLIMDKGKVRMTSRVKSVVTHRFDEHQDKVPHFRDMKVPFTGKTVLDGELTSPVDKMDTGAVITNSRLQAAVAVVHSETNKALAMQAKNGKLEYNAFDILFYDGKDVRELPYEQRDDLVKEAITKIKEANPGLPINFAPTIRQYSSVQDIFTQHVGRGEEGVMLKRKSAPYQTGYRSKDILKMKRQVTVDGWISGFVPSKAATRADLIGGFEISSNVDGKPQVIAAISGIDDATRKDATIIKDGQPALNPKYLRKCVEIEGQEFTSSGRLQHARFIQWRPDKNPEDCQISSEDMKIPGSEA